MSTRNTKPILLEDGWNEIERTIGVLQNLLESGFDQFNLLGEESKTESKTESKMSSSSSSKLSNKGPNKMKKERLFNNKEYIHVYSLCYNMCTQRTPFNWSKELYERHGITVESYLKNKVLPALKAKDGIQLLQELCARWTNHQIMNKWMSQFFTYLNRFYVTHNGKADLLQAGLKAFKAIVFDEMKVQTTQAVLVEIEKERNGQIVDRALLKTCLSVYFEMGMNSHGVYDTEFEAAMLDATEIFYAAKSREWIDVDDTPSYLLKVEKTIFDEKQRVANYLLESSELKLLRRAHDELLKAHQTTLLEKPNSGIKALLVQNRTEDIMRMYKLFSQIDNGVQPIADHFKAYVRELGDDIIHRRQESLQSGKTKDSANAPDFVNALLRLQTKAEKFCEHEFGQNTLVKRAMKDAFEHFINHSIGEHKNAELFATYCDRLLKTGGEKISDSELKQRLEDIVKLFSYLTDKDLFAEVYRNQLGKRLLNNRCADLDAEQIMLQKLKSSCGAQFTNKMEGMMEDLRKNKNIVQAFDKYRRTQAAANATVTTEDENETGTSSTSSTTSNSESSSSAMSSEESKSGERKKKTDSSNAVRSLTGVESHHKINFSVQILSQGFWPTYKCPELRLNTAMNACVASFNKFYTTNPENSHRKLTWVYSLGNGEAHFQPKDRKYIILCHTLQIAVLCLFNKSPDGSVAFSQIGEELNLEQDIVKKVIHSLLKCKLIKKRKDKSGKDSAGSNSSSSSSPQKEKEKNESSSGGSKEKKKKKKKGSKLISSKDVFVINMNFSSQQVRFRLAMPSLEANYSKKKVESNRGLSIEAAIVRIMKARKKLKHQILVAEVLQQLSDFRPNPTLVNRKIEALIEREYLERDEDQVDTFNYLA